MALKKKPVTGMKDILPGEMEIRDYVLNIIKDTYRGYGFSAIETPCVEHIENLTSKQGGDNEKLIFKILKRGEKLNVEAAQTEADVVDGGLRYDLTLPLSRYYANNSANLSAPFKALQVGAVRELIGKIYAPGFGKREVAALAPLVGAAAEQGDAAALQIVEMAGRELALLVRPVAEKLGLQSARIAFAGSVLQKCAPVRSAAQTQLQTLLPQLTLAEPQGDAAAGAVLLARCKAEE